MPDAGEADADAGTSLFIVYNALGISREILLPEGKWQLLTDGRRFKIREKDQELEASENGRAVSGRRRAPSRY